MFALWILIGFSTCSGIFIWAPICDREHKLRYLMNFIGMNSLAYYTGNLIADMILFLLPTIGFIIMLFPMQITVFTSWWHIMFGIMVCFGFSLINLTYLVNFIFSKSTVAFRQVGGFYLLLGFLAPNMVIAMSYVALGETFGNFI